MPLARMPLSAGRTDLTVLAVRHGDLVADEMVGGLDAGPDRDMPAGR